MEDAEDDFDIATVDGFLINAFRAPIPVRAPELDAFSHACYDLSYPHILRLVRRDFAEAHPECGVSKAGKPGTTVVVTSPKVCGVKRKLDEGDNVVDGEGATENNACQGGGQDDTPVPNKKRKLDGPDEDAKAEPKLSTASHAVKAEPANGTHTNGVSGGTGEEDEEPEDEAGSTKEGSEERNGSGSAPRGRGRPLGSTKAAIARARSDINPSAATASNASDAGDPGGASEHSERVDTDRRETRGMARAKTAQVAETRVEEKGSTRAGSESDASSSKDERVERSRGGGARGRGARGRSNAAGAAEPEICNVEMVLRRKKRRNKVMYLIKWQGYSDAHNTWEPENMLREDVPELLDDFNKERAARQQHKAK